MRELIEGNEAVVRGALAAGCKFFAGYPITPASEISELLSVELPKVGGTFIQMEDELASMGAVIGASLAGVKSMTATSGPGFSLMQENLGFAYIAEVPCVIVNVMRGGPSTGLPTNVAQGDVMQARWGTHGEHNIIALSVSTTLECFEITVKAFNLAEKYRVPVIVLSDAMVAHTGDSVELPEKVEIVDRIKPRIPPRWFSAYSSVRAGVPAMASFGDGYRHHVSGRVHDIKGYPTQLPFEIEPFMKRLFYKLDRGADEIKMVKRFMMDDAEVAIIAYGSVARSAHQAVVEARARGVKVGLLQLITLFPFPDEEVKRVLDQCSKTIVVEMNMGQVVLIVKRVNEGASEIVQYNRVDGQIITPEEICEQL